MSRIPLRPSALILALLTLFLGACGGGGGGGGGSGGGSGGTGGVNQGADPSTTDAGKQAKTWATSQEDGRYQQHDAIPGGIRADESNFPQTGLDIVGRALLAILQTKTTDLDADLEDTDLDGLADPGIGFEAYGTGMESGPTASARIFAANNIYDLFQTTTGSPRGIPLPDGVNVLYPSVNGSTGGPGLFSNVPNTIMPKLFSLPNAMGERDPDSGSARGPSATDEHQFVQTQFAYDLDPTSLFNYDFGINSNLGDSVTPNNVFVEARWLIQDPDSEDDVALPVDQSFQRRHVPGVGIIGMGTFAVTSVEGLGGGGAIILDPATSNIPEGAWDLLFEPNTFTYVSHENPSGITETSPADIGMVNPFTNELILPDPTDMDGFGGRVFGANTAVPSSVNDFLSDGDTDAAVMGFFLMKITRLRSASGSPIQNPYFHSFDMGQDYVGDPTGDPTEDIDPRAPFGIASFNRGPAVYIDPQSQLPDISVLNPSSDIIAEFNPNPTSDADGNIVSTRTRFRIDFDKEVVPNSVGFSRRHTIQRTSDLGVVFKFTGNTRPVPSPAGQFVAGGEGAPTTATVYLCVNQPGQTLTNAPESLSAQAGNTDPNTGQEMTDAGVPITPGDNGLDPSAHNTLATIPRAPVPIDVYPLNQNNLNSYVIEPLIEIPNGAVVTVGVTVQGLNVSGANLQGGTTNRGNYTRGGTMYTTFQGLTPTGLGADVSQLTGIVGDRTVIKVNAGAMDLQGNLVYGGTSVSTNTLIDGDIFLPNGTQVSNDNVTGGFNVSRTFQVGSDGKRVYVNAPVSPMALYAGYTNGGMGIVDLNGTGFNTNAPGGGLVNVGFKNYLISSRYLPLAVIGGTTFNNWNSAGAFPSDHKRALGVLSRYTSGGSFGTPAGTESDMAVGAPIPTGFLTPQPGVNEGSSGYETMVSDSKGNDILTSGNQIGVVRDLQVGDFLDAIIFDEDNTFAKPANHRTVFGVTSSVANNTIADPPLPNPPPLRYPIGLPHTSVKFNQNDLTVPPVAIEGNEVFPGDNFMGYTVGGGGAVTTSQAVNGLIQLNPTFNASNPNPFDIPPLPLAGFPNPFPGGFATNPPVAFVQTGPQPKTSTTAALVLTLNALLGFAPTPNGLIPSNYQARQQIGNFLFVADATNKEVHAINSNTMEILRSVRLPDPYGMGLTSDSTRLFVSNEADNSVSVVDADPRSGTFMTELNRTKVGLGPRGVTVCPDQEDAFVMNFLGNTISIVEASSGLLRKTLSDSGINRPWDMAIGMREITGAPAFQSGVYHGYISNFGANNVLIYQSGPDGLAGIGFDSIIGDVTPNGAPSVGDPTWRDMVNPRGIVYDPTSPLDAQSGTVGCYVAHKDQDGFAMVSRLRYGKDDSPGQQFVSDASPGFGTKVFEVFSQYVSDIPGEALDVALPDYNRRFFEQQTWGTPFPSLFNSGSVLLTIPGINLPRNAKYPLTALAAAGSSVNNPRWQPDRVYLSVQGGRILSFDNFNPQAPPNVIETPRDVRVLTSYFSQ